MGQSDFDILSCYLPNYELFVNSSQQITAGIGNNLNVYFLYQIGCAITAKCFARAKNFAGLICVRCTVNIPILDNYEGIHHNKMSKAIKFIIFKYQIFLDYDLII